MQNKIDVVITMGGVGSRFRKCGYNVPKYMIEANSKTLFEWSLISLDGIKDSVNKYFFIALKDNEVNVENFIKKQCEKLNIQNYKIILIDKLTDGQATTAMLAKDYWISSNALLIYNIDTYVEKEQIKSSDFKGDGFIPCFHAEGEHWSFVRIDNYGNVVEIKEKERISDNCTIGAYYFRTCELYEKLYNDYYKDSENCVNGEKYIAPLYNYLLTLKGQIYISNIDSKYVHILGTPEELELFVKS